MKILEKVTALADVRGGIEPTRALQISMATARKWVEGENMGEEFFELLDEAQGVVHSGEANESYVIIKITRDE